MMRTRTPANAAEAGLRDKEAARSYRPDSPERAASSEQQAGKEVNFERAGASVKDILKKLKGVQE